MRAVHEKRQSSTSVTKRQIGSVKLALIAVHMLCISSRTFAFVDKEEYYTEYHHKYYKTANEHIPVPSILPVWSLWETSLARNVLQECCYVRHLRPRRGGILHTPLRNGCDHQCAFTGVHPLKGWVNPLGRIGDTGVQQVIHHVSELLVAIIDSISACEDLEMMVNRWHGK